MKKKAPGKPRHVPQRTCIACRQRYDKRQLTRIVVSKEDGVVVDPSGKRDGRGAYLCHNSACWDKAVGTKGLLDLALKTAVTAEARQALAEYRPVTIQVME